MTARLAPLFDACRTEQRAALIGYLPAGYPTVPRSKELFAAMTESGCDLVEVGMPYSDPVMDGPTIQAAAETALRAGMRLRDLFSVVESVANAGGRAVVMTYWNPVHRYGVDAFARDLAAAGGLGMITPDLLPEEAEGWLSAATTHDLDHIFLVAPSSTEQRRVAVGTSSSGACPRSPGGGGTRGAQRGPGRGGGRVRRRRHRRLGVRHLRVGEH